MKKQLLLPMLFSFVCLFAQPTIAWQKCLGGTNEEWSRSIQQTADGGYIVAGGTTSNDGTVTDNHGDNDFWVVKLTAAGAIEWQKCLGGTGTDLATSVQQTIDGGYIVGGYTESNDGDVTDNHGEKDFWVVKLDPTGTIEWQKCLGGTASDEIYFILQTTDGGYIATGASLSNDGDVTSNHGNSDFWVVKLDHTGVIDWQKSLGGTDLDTAFCIQQTTDKGYIVSGHTQSNDGDVTGNHGKTDFWIVKLDNTGTIEWQKCLGGTAEEWYPSIQQTTDGGYILDGKTISNDGDITGNNGSYDFWVAKLDASGTIEWQKSLGGTRIEWAEAIEQTTDGGYMIAGSSQSNDGDVSGNHGGIYDVWVVKLTATGEIDWQKCLGGTAIEYANAIQQTANGGYVIAGTTTSNDQDVSGNHGKGDMWIVHLSNSLGLKEVTAENTFTIYPNPAVNEINVKIESHLLGAIYTLYDTSGKTVLTGTLDSENSTINSSALPKGVYAFSLGITTKAL